MAQTKDGAQKAKAYMLEKYGADYYVNLGKLGGKAPGAPKGFATMSFEKLSEAGRRGGSHSPKKND